MSYGFTCYCNDAGIDTTSVYVYGIGVSYSNYYGSSSLGDWDDFGSSGFDSSWSMRFTATPASGYTFSHWAYRVGSTSATLQTSTDNPFYYYEGEDIYIRAVSTEEEEDVWDRVTRTAATSLATEYSTYFRISAMTIYRYKVSFANSGTATFYTEGSTDTYGYLTTATGWNESTGKPSDNIQYNDDGGEGSNFKIEYDVVAGRTYYIWIRCYSDSESGYTDLYIIPPTSRPSDFAWTYDKTKGGTFNLTAKEWNSLTSKINEFRKYRGLSSYNFTYAYKGDTFTATMYNEARSAIRGIDGYGSYIYKVSSGDNITAYAMNVLVTELNAIP